MIKKRVGAFDLVVHDDGSYIVKDGERGEWESCKCGTLELGLLFGEDFAIKQTIAEVLLCLYDGGEDIIPF